MKLLRLITLIGAVVLVLIVAAVAALFLPSVQTRIARSVLARPGAVTGQVDSLHAGLKTTEWSNLQLRGDGWTLLMPSAMAEVPIVGAIRKDVHVHSFIAHGWVLDLSAAHVSPAVVLEQPAEGGHVGFVSGPFPGTLDWLPSRLMAHFRH